MAQRVVFKVDEPVAALGVEVASVPVCVCVCACVCVCVVVRRLLGTPCTQGFTAPASGRGPQRPWSRRRAAGRRAVSTPPPPPPPRTRRHASACGRVPAAPTAHGAARTYKSRWYMSPRWVAVCRAHTPCANLTAHSPAHTSARGHVLTRLSQRGGTCDGQLHRRVPACTHFVCGTSSTACAHSASHTKQSQRVLRRGVAHRGLAQREGLTSAGALQRVVPEGRGFYVLGSSAQQKTCPAWPQDDAMALMPAQRSLAGMPAQRRPRVALKVCVRGMVAAVSPGTAPDARISPFSALLRRPLQPEAARCSRGRRR
jgi:hypothetical protein